MLKVRDQTHPTSEVDGVEVLPFHHFAIKMIQIFGISDMNFPKFQIFQPTPKLLNSLLVGCGAVWHHRAPREAIRAQKRNQDPSRTFRSTKNILSDASEPSCHQKPTQTVKITVLLKYCLNSENAVRTQIDSNETIDD